MMTDQTFDSTAFEELVVSTVKKGHFDGRVFDYEDLKNTDIAMKQ